MGFFVYSRDASGTPDRTSAMALLRAGVPGLDAFQTVELHDWEFGGRR